MLHSAPRGSLCAEAFRVIEADLEAFSPGRAAAHDGHGRLAERERAFSTIMYILLIQQAVVAARCVCAALTLYLYCLTLTFWNTSGIFQSISPQDQTWEKGASVCLT